MNNIALAAEANRKILFNQTAEKKGIPTPLVEKDFWVCWTLGKLFKDSEISKLILFKGGTSLSKVFNLIERFSEDIDLILDWRLVSDNNFNEKRSKTKQDLFNKQVNASAADYLKGIFLPMLKKLITPVCDVELDATDPHVINLIYPVSFQDSYVLPQVRLEIGPLASWVPNAEYTITPYAAEEFPDVFKEPSCMVKAIKAERTFWEKVTILHQEAHRPANKPSQSRYSRHYYDLYQMLNSPIRKQILEDLDLLAEVVAFKQKFYPRSWARYDLAKPGTLKTVPESFLIEGLKADYKRMRNMIFGNYPDFDEILACLEDFDLEVNSV